MLTERDQQDINQAVRLLIAVIERHHVHDEDVAERRAAFRFVKDDPNVLPFPTNAKTPPATAQEAESTKLDEGVFKFTEKEILKMPKPIRKIFRTNKKNAHVRFWRGVYEIRLMINGQRIEASAKQLSVAKERFIKKLNEYSKHGILTKGKGKKLLLPYIKQWFETVKKPFIKETTYKMYLQLYNAYIAPKFDQREMDSITKFELQEFINEFVITERYRTAQKLTQVLSAVFDYAVDDGIIERSPMKRVVVAHYEEEHGLSLTREEEKILITTLLGEPSNTYAQAYAFMVYTGIRRGELASAELNDGWVYIVSGKQRKGLKAKSRRIPVCPMLEKLLPYIELETIKKISPGMLTKHIKDFLPSHHCHDLRHTFITRAQECGISREIVSLWAGHAADSSITSTVYTHLEQNEAHQIEAMRLFSYDLT